MTQERGEEVMRLAWRSHLILMAPFETKLTIGRQVSKVLPTWGAPRSSPDRIMITNSNAGPAILRQVVAIEAA
ncbi:hypothetical protein [Bradyrhizobium pachyrhizi]|uniref:hypothetical protein n=1 Tax=Bradyrhizobium pachyrhizi TaxID=280333 RepID=UPI003D36DDC4